VLARRSWLSYTRPGHWRTGLQSHLARWVSVGNSIPNEILEGAIHALTGRSRPTTSIDTLLPDENVTTSATKKHVFPGKTRVRGRLWRLLRRLTRVQGSAQDDAAPAGMDMHG